MSLSVKPEDGEAVLFGKAVNELQSEVVVADDEVTGTLSMSMVMLKNNV